MFTPAAHKRIAWLLIFALAIIFGAGEGLHWIPGCGHGVEVGGRILFLGIRVEGGGTPHGDTAHIERPKDGGIPIWDADECPICSVLAQKYSPAGLVQYILVMPFVHCPPVAVACAAPSPAPRLFQARAPPLA